MSDFVGVKKLSDFQTNPSFKRDALIFDRIAISSITDFVRMIVEGFPRDEIRDYCQELAWLLKNEIVFQPDFTAEENGALRSNNELESILELSEQHERKPKEVLMNFKTEFWNWWDILNEYRTRTLAVKLRVGSQLDAYPISNLTDAEQNRPKNEVVRVVIHNLPTPSESTSWEQIIEYRSDPDSHSKFLALRNWINEIRSENLTPIEVEQKLEYLVDQYRQHMKLHRMKTNAGTIETIVIAGSEMLEELIRLRFSKAAKALFSLRQGNVALLEGELTSPGKEVAYILKARERFC